MTRRAVSRFALAVLLWALAPAPRAAILLAESFDDASTLAPAGWLLVNASVPGGNTWFQGNPGPFAAQSGAAGAYAAANFLSTGVTGTVSQWLMTPVLTLHGGEIITFYTRSADPGFGDVLNVRLSQGSGSTPAGFTTILRTIGDASTPYPTGGWAFFSVAVPAIPGLTSGRIGFQYAPGSAASADYVGIDSLAIEGPDGDGDGITDSLDNCPTIANADQADTPDLDGVGNACDNCTTVANPRPAGCFTSATCGAWATLTGGQRDDDHDGYGNRCDAKFSGTGLVGATDLAQLRASSNKNRALDTCGTTNLRPCAIFDLSEADALIGAPDIGVFRTLNNKLPGPKCAACPLPCTMGTAGTCIP